MYLSLILLVVFGVCAGMLAKQGLWNNTLSLINVILAALIATNYFELLANFLDKQSPGLTYFWDFASLWILFAVSFLILRAVTDALSKVKVRFPHYVDLVGGILMAVWTAWILLCFATMTLHTAPLPRNFLEFQEQPETKMLFGLAPDRQWLAWMHRQSRGTYSRLGDLNPFDIKGDFILRYASRREDFENEKGLTKGGK